MASDWAAHASDRLRLTRPTLDDLDGWHTIHSDPRVWEHFPSGRHTDIGESEAALGAAISDWGGAGLGY